jgi:hypothetical protein
MPETGGDKNNFIYQDVTCVSCMKQRNEFTTGMK